MTTEEEFEKVIRDRYTKIIVVEGKYVDIREACEKNKAILNKVNLSGADLRKADLREADLREADLFGTKIDADQKEVVLEDIGIVIKQQGV